MTPALATEEPFERLSDDEFRDQLGLVIPSLRAFARSLSGNRDHADDLVQETMLKAWNARARFSAGTNFRAWTYTILRNHFLSEARRNRFHGEWSDTVAEIKLSAPAEQDRKIELADVQRALTELPAAQREVLMLVAGGFSYEEMSEVCGVAVGTIKSRVCRARVALVGILDSGCLATSRANFTARPEEFMALIANYANSRPVMQRLAA